MNATVTLPLSEIDDLRNEKDQYKKTAEDLEKTQMQVRLLFDIRTITTEWPDRRGYGSPYPREVEGRKLIETKYIGLDDVKATLRTEAEAFVRAQISELKDKIEDSRTREDKLVSSHRKILEEKNKEIAILKGEQVDRSKDEEIKTLVEKYTTLQQST